MTSCGVPTGVQQVKHVAFPQFQLRWDSVPSLFLYAAVTAKKKKKKKKKKKTRKPDISLYSCLQNLGREAVFTTRQLIVIPKPFIP